MHVRSKAVGSKGSERKRSWRRDKEACTGGNSEEGKKGEREEADGVAREGIWEGREDGEGMC